MVTPPLIVNESDIDDIVRLIAETLKDFERELGR
jgi:adenosylmethionine-8-amino-7-oxononanoate aminotransferase